MPGASTSAALNRAVHRYRAAPLGARVFVHGRAFLSDLAFVERFVPRNGFIVDLGCGHGLFACLPREVDLAGVEVDPEDPPRRRRLAQQASKQPEAAAEID